MPNRLQSHQNFVSTSKSIFFCYNLFFYMSKNKQAKNNLLFVHWLVLNATVQINDRISMSFHRSFDLFSKLSLKTPIVT